MRKQILNEWSFSSVTRKEFSTSTDVLLQVDPELFLFPNVSHLDWPWERDRQFINWIPQSLAISDRIAVCLLLKEFFICIINDNSLYSNRNIVSL